MLEGVSSMMLVCKRGWMMRRGEGRSLVSASWRWEQMQLWLRPRPALMPAHEASFQGTRCQATGSGNEIVWTRQQLHRGTGKSSRSSSIFLQSEAEASAATARRHDPTCTMPDAVTAAGSEASVAPEGMDGQVFPAELIEAP